MAEKKTGAHRAHLRPAVIFVLGGEISFFRLCLFCRHLVVDANSEIMKNRGAIKKCTTAMAVRVKLIRYHIGGYEAVGPIIFTLSFACFDGLVKLGKLKAGVEYLFVRR